MEATVRGVTVHYAEFGSGTPVLALHGAGVDHREVAGALEPMFSAASGFRRLYPDLPGMGRTPAPETVASNDEVVEVLLDFIDDVVGSEPLLVLGHSYGGYLARAIAQHRPEQVIGLALVCPIGAQTRNVPDHEVLVSSADLAIDLGPELEASYRGYFVIQTPETLSRFRDLVAPAVPLVDEAALMRIFSRWELRHPETGNPYPHPALILAGRQDSTAGYSGPADLARHYPRCTFAVLDHAGHALLHEQPALAQALIVDWLAGVHDRND
ncbi:alpha/beta fold hydrolase [Arthrobacter sp. B3I4]|uniref:alpha/beta fold hydrolase n=1 Tax=Arthrobacter sp. B3I4 TaxID=3042267 RepID=UPI0027821F45|nr:alpha/beta hydrolase [Arthrobacter sp. B3I4]MDQ0755068.1 pimeloyl-ACP methyl ester carboxylesterase [Arthrobacter sp. B3I4]